MSTSANSKTVGSKRSAVGDDAWKVLTLLLAAHPEIGPINYTKMAEYDALHYGGTASFSAYEHKFRAPKKLAKEIREKAETLAAASASGAPKKNNARKRKAAPAEDSEGGGKLKKQCSSTEGAVGGSEEVAGSVGSAVGQASDEAIEQAVEKSGEFKFDNQLDELKAN